MKDNEKKIITEEIYPYMLLPKNIIKNQIENFSNKKYEKYIKLKRKLFI